jgi:hypothetical protein
MTLANREAFLKPRQCKVVEIETDLGVVRLQELRGSELSAIYDWAKPNGKVDKKRSDNLAVRILIESIVDETGNRFLTEDDIGVINDYPTSLRNQLIEAAMDLHKIGQKEESVELRGKSSS